MFPHFPFLNQDLHLVSLFAFVITKTIIITFTTMLPNIDSTTITQPSFTPDRFIVTKEASKPSFVSIE